MEIVQQIMPATATSADDLPPCDQFIYQHGELLLEADITTCGELLFEDWVTQVRTAAGQGQLVDWCSNDFAQVLFVGNFDVVATAAKSMPCPAVIVRWAE